MSYTVCEAFIEMRDGKAVHHKEVGSVVELDDDTAGPLLESGTIASDGTGDQWQEAVTLDEVKKYAVSRRHRGEPNPAADEPTDEPAAESGES